MQEKIEKATFAGGCFWCVEAVFEREKGVKSVTSGYIGGETENPTYEEVCNGNTGHAEAIEILFNPEEISYERLVSLFWEAHDPTTLNRQGADVGTQYRSAIFYHSDKQKEIAEKSKAAADASGRFRSPIVTEIAEATIFYPAEPYHQDYFQNNPNAGYSIFVIKPKLQKLQK